MSLLSGKLQDTVSKNIHGLMQAYKQNGRIGKIVPRDMAHARRIASAIANTKAREEE